MAQKLKDDVRKAIIEATKIELLEKGYKGASLREIAKRADITVGNLYRYYKNKDDLCNGIVGPTYLKIKACLDKLESLDVSYHTHVYDLQIDDEKIYTRIDDFAEELIDIYLENKDDFNILLNTKLANDFINKFETLIYSAIKDRSIYFQIKVDVKTLTSAFSNAIFNGLKNILLNNKSNNKELKDIVKIYFRSYLSLLKK